jgi:hypothetical protein
MAMNRRVFPVLPTGEQPAVERVSAETAVARVHVEWDDAARVTPLGQLPFFIEYVKQGGLFDGWVSGCPLYFSSPNAPSKRDVLGTVLLSVLAGHWRYAHMTTLRCDPVNPPLLGMRKVVSEDAVRRPPRTPMHRIHDNRSSSMRIYHVAIFVVTLIGSAAMAADPDHGSQLAKRWCATCHLVDSDQKQASADVLPFATIARKPDFSPEKLAFFLLDPHPKMPNFPLSRAEAADIAAYIASLRK